MHAPRWSRRQLVTALALGPVASAWAATPARREPPVARIEPVSETLWGETIVDRYRWMENPKDRDWEPFMRGQADHARRVLDSLFGRRALRERISALSGGLPIARAPQLAGRRLFYLLWPKGANQFKLYMREGEGGPSGC